jgi:hypothetical protein
VDRGLRLDVRRSAASPSEGLRLIKGEQGLAAGNHDLHDSWLRKLELKER